MAYRGEGHSIWEACERFSVSPRTVHRAIRRLSPAPAAVTQATEATAVEALEYVHEADALARMFDPDAGTESAILATDVLDTMVGTIAKALASAAERGVSGLPSSLLPMSRAALVVVDMARTAALEADWERAAHHLLAAQACVDALADDNRPA
ncbi:MAG: hypothetical protein IIC94_05930 [Chloroflexi bacterium]|nr:hypothetical protein [Chloroflexota bacterium]